jgi:hypothetical protein
MEIKKTENPPSAGDWILLASLNEEMLSKELRLINDRVGWITATQSILFGAFYVLLINQDKLPQAVNILPKVILLVSIPILVGAYIGVVAAQKVIDQLEKERSFYQRTLSEIFDYRIPDVGCYREGSLMGTRVLGSTPFFWVTVILFIIWVTILLIIVARLP